MDWHPAPDVAIEVESDDTSFAGSPPHAVALHLHHYYLIGIEGTADELRDLARRFSDAVADLR